MKLPKVLFVGMVAFKIKIGEREFSEVQLIWYVSHTNVDKPTIPSSDSSTKLECC